MFRQYDDQLPADIVRFFTSLLSAMPSICQLDLRNSPISPHDAVTNSILRAMKGFAGTITMLDIRDRDINAPQLELICSGLSLLDSLVGQLSSICTLTPLGQLTCLRRLSLRTYGSQSSSVFPHTGAKCQLPPLHTLTALDLADYHPALHPWHMDYESLVNRCPKLTELRPQTFAWFDDACAAWSWCETIPYSTTFAPGDLRWLRTLPTFSTLHPDLGRRPCPNSNLCPGKDARASRWLAILPHLLNEIPGMRFIRYSVSADMPRSWRTEVIPAPIAQQCFARGGDCRVSDFPYFE
jgi:hypothetical protein